MTEPTTDKLFISANTLLNDAFRLGQLILASGFTPDILVALWRGGTPVAIGIQELLGCAGVEHEHFVVKTRHYAGIDHRRDDILVDGLEPVLQAVRAKSRVLIVDDVFDTGLTLDKLLGVIESCCDQAGPAIRIATPYFKPGNNRTGRKPDFYLHTTDRWIVFPHELAGLSAAEIRAGKPELPVLAEMADCLAGSGGRP